MEHPVSVEMDDGTERDTDFIGGHDAEFHGWGDDEIADVLGLGCEVYDDVFGCVGFQGGDGLVRCGIPDGDLEVCF